jgi:hypothetical protein
MLEEVAKGLHAGSCRSPLIERPIGDSGPLMLMGQMMENPPCAIYFNMKGGSGIAPPHAHDGWALTLVLKGSWKVGEIWQKEGDVTLAEPNIFNGPFEPGPEGVYGLEIFSSLQAVPPIWGEYANDPWVLKMAETAAEDAANLVIYPPPSA